MEDGRQDSFDSALSALKEALRGFIGEVISEKVEEMKRDGTIPSGRRPPVEIDEALLREAAGVPDEMKTAAGPEREESARAAAREVLLDALGDPETPAARMIDGMVQSAVERAVSASGGAAQGVDEKIGAALEAVRVPTEEAITALIRREIRNSSGTGALPSEDMIAEIARREAENAVVRIMPVAAAPVDPAQFASVLADERAREALIEAVRPALQAAPAALSEDAVAEMVGKASEEAGKVADEKIRAAFEEISGRVLEEAANVAQNAVQSAAPAIDIDAIAALITRETKVAVESVAGEDKVRETAAAAVREILAEEAKDLMVRIKADMQAGIDQKIADFAGSEEFAKRVADAMVASKAALGIPEEGMESGVRNAVGQAMSSDDFKAAVEQVVKGAAPSLKTTAEELAEPMAALATKTTEKILAREAEGLVRQIKIELGKLRNDMKKGPDKAQVIEIAGGLVQEEMGKLKAEFQSLLASKDFKTLVAAVAGDALAPKFDAMSGKSASPDGVKEIAAEAAEEIATKVSQESLKGFLSEIGDKVETSIESKVKEFMRSDQLRETAGKMASDSVMGILFSEDTKEMIRSLAREGAGGGGGGGGGGGVDEEAVKSIVAGELKRRTEEAFADMIPRHVGKFLDEKLPPPEYFNSLVTSAQLKAELDKRMTGSGAGKASGWGGGGGPGETAVFTSMIQRILNSQELKEAMDDRFKVISNFIKSELVPKEVKKMLKDKA